MFSPFSQRGPLWDAVTSVFLGGCLSAKLFGVFLVVFYVNLLGDDVDSVVFFKFEIVPWSEMARYVSLY